MFNNIKQVASVIDLMDKQLREELFVKDGVLQEKKLWENTYIKKQIDKREKGESFTIQDHIRGMVYSMLSSGMSWNRVEKGIDLKTGKITPIDDIFHQYDVAYLLQCKPEKLKDEIINIHCGSQYTAKQITALINANINKLINIEKQYGSIDNCYEEFVEKDKTLKSLVKSLSNPTSKNKMVQMGEALVAEYLKNVGYSIAKPDRHIRRILGCEVLGCSNRKVATVYEAFDIVQQIADEINKPTAEVDYILWAYCATGYGQICTTKYIKCDSCVAKDICHRKINN